MVMSEVIVHVLKRWEKERGWIGWSKSEDEVYPRFFSPEPFTLILGDREREVRRLDRRYRRMYVGKDFWRDLKPGAILRIKKVDDRRFKIEVEAEGAPMEMPLNLHERAIRRWAEMELEKFGAWFRPEIIKPRRRTQHTQDEGPLLHLR